MPLKKMAVAILCCWLPLPLLAASFESLLASALEHNRNLASIHQDWQSRKATADASGFLPDPMITLDVSTPINQEQQLMLEQKLPWFGTRDLQRQEKNAEATSTYWQWQLRRLELQNQLAQMYGELFLWQRSVEISQYNIRLWQELEAIAIARYRVAAATQPDLVRIQVGNKQAQDRLLSLQQQQRTLQARLRLLTGSADSVPPSRWPETLPIMLQEREREALVQRIDRHPALQQLDAVMGAADIGVKLADKRYGPDITLRYGRMFVDPDMEGSGLASQYLGVGLNIPLWTTQYDASKKAAVSRGLALQSQRSYLQDQLHSQLEQSLFQLQDNDRQLTLYRDELIPRTEEALQSRLRAYQTGDAGFLDVIDTEKQLIDLQMLAIRFEQQRWNAFHAVLLSSGLPFGDWQQGVKP